MPSNCLPVPKKWLNHNFDLLVIAVLTLNVLPCHFFVESQREQVFLTCSIGFIFASTTRNSAMHIRSIHTRLLAIFTFAILRTPLDLYFWGWTDSTQD